MLIRNASGIDGRPLACRIEGERIVALDTALPEQIGETVIEAGGGLLLPGLRDHHLHLQSAAAARAAIACGPPQVQDFSQLAASLRTAARHQPQGWLRGIGYHESVAGELNADQLEECVPGQPLRIQHRSGRLWLLNRSALRELGLRDGGGDDPCERVNGRLSGRLYDADLWLRERVPRQRPTLTALSRALAARGVVAVCDTTPHNGPEDFAHFAQAQARGELLQQLRVMGDARLDGQASLPGVQLGATKFHLHDHELPEFDSLCAQIRASHAAGRAVAFHCVSRTDLGYALAALQDAGCEPGDRIEHASVTPPELMALIRRLPLRVVTQPNFIAERGEAYRREVAADDQPWLYRLRGFLDAGVPLAGSTDAPFGELDPWAAMQAAVRRCTAQGESLAADEALSPEQALALYTGTLEAPDAGPLQVQAGQRADLCLLQQAWSALRENLAAARPLYSWRAGELIHRPAPA